MTPFEKAKNEAAEKHGGYTSDHGTKFRSFEAGADWAYAFAKSEDREAIEELVNVLELVRSQMCWERDRDQLSMGLCDLHSTVTEALAKFRAGQGESNG